MTDSDLTPATRYIVEAWPHLSPHVRGAILTLIAADVLESHSQKDSAE